MMMYRIPSGVGVTYFASLSGYGSTNTVVTNFSIFIPVWNRIWQRRKCVSEMHFILEDNPLYEKIAVNIDDVQLVYVNLVNKP